MFRDEEATLADPTDGHFVVHHLNEVTEPIDPRIQPTEKATAHQLDEPYTRQLSDYVHHKDRQEPPEKPSPEEEILYVCFLFFVTPIHVLNWCGID